MIFKNIFISDHFFLLCFLARCEVTGCRILFVFSPNKLQLHPLALNASVFVFSGTVVSGQHFYTYLIKWL